MNKLFSGLALLIILFNHTNCVVLGVAAGAAAGVVIAEERTVGNVLDDNVDVNAIRISLSKKKEIYKDVNIEVFEGRVLVTGRVDNEEDKENLYKIIWPKSRVIEVINEVIIMEDIKESNINNFMHDSWLNAKIRSLLLFNSKTKSMNYKIVVFNMTAYLIGVAKSQDEINTMLDIVSRVDGIDNVKSFVILKDDKRRNRKLS